MKKALIGLAALSFIAGSASAANRLNDLQLDTVTANQVLGDESVSWLHSRVIHFREYERGHLDDRQHWRLGGIVVLVEHVRTT